MQVGLGVVYADRMVGVLLFNDSSENFRFTVGDRAAQLVFEQVEVSRNLMFTRATHFNHTVFKPIETFHTT